MASQRHMACKMPIAEKSETTITNSVTNKKASSTVELMKKPATAKKIISKIPVLTGYSNSL